MSIVLPGQPRSSPQGLTTGFWKGRHISAYVTGSALTIIRAPQTILQTIYDDDDTPIEAITLDEATGKLATCTNSHIRIYKPILFEQHSLKWAQESTFDIPLPDPATQSLLSWGQNEELLVAATGLTLFTTKGEPKSLWTESLPNPPKTALISHDSAYIASIGCYDRAVKLWRRLNFGQEDVRFALTYLRHPSIITGMRWRKPLHLNAVTDNVLYTWSSDHHLRVWTPKENGEGQRWHLWAKVNLLASSGDFGPLSDPWLSFVVDGRDFTASVEHAVKDRMADDSSTDDIALDHLVAIANRSPEICISLDRTGVLSAWALENVCSETANKPKVFDVVQLKSRSFESFNSISADARPHVEVQTYCDTSTGALNILLHSFDGRIGVYTANVADLLDPLTNERRLSLEAIWTGNTSSIRKIIRNYSGKAIVSKTTTGESILWSHSSSGQDASGTTLSRRSVVPELPDVRRIAVLHDGRFVVFLRKETISLWDCRRHGARNIAEAPYAITGEPLCLIILPQPPAEELHTAYIATIGSDAQGIVWRVSLPADASGSSRGLEASLEEFSHFRLDNLDGLAYVLSVDPAGSIPIKTNFLDMFARDVAVSYTVSGKVNFWAARVDSDKQRVDWLSTSTTDTGITSPALVSGSTLRKAALVNSTRSEVTIWDIGGSRLEFEENYKTNNVVQDLDWTSTPDSQSILAIGFQYRVLLVAQMRYDYLNQGPAWATIREISTRDLTPHPIGDSAWLGGGFLVVGAGNQMFVYDREMPGSEITKHHLPNTGDRSWDMFEAVQRFNGPLPVFHPQFISQCILSGKAELVHRILVALQHTLKYFLAGEILDDYLGMAVESFFDGTVSPNETETEGKVTTTNGTSKNDDDWQGGDAEDVFSNEVATALNEKLTKISIPQLSGREQMQLADIIECLALVERHRRSMDENAARFMLFYRQHALGQRQLGDSVLSWREINWAFHSTSQDILTDFVSQQNHGSLLWEHARDSGMFMWLNDNSAVRKQFEIVARNEYTKSDNKDPVGCSIFYLALKKKTILQGLWRMATWNREQSATQKLLANNFDEPKWKTAALKNAYALISKRRFAYAAAFFLLGGNLSAAVDVCLHQLKDLQLAVAVARVYEGDDGPVLWKLLHDDLLPIAAQQGNRWLASWVFWMIKRKDMAVQSLITPVYSLIDSPQTPDLEARLFLTDDPALVVLYSQLRERTLQTLQGAFRVTPKAEWDFVLHSAKLYDRMGCDLLGLDLVRNWEFQLPPPTKATVTHGSPRLLRRRSSIVVDDLSPSHQRQPSKGAIRENVAPQTTFEEPDAASLLDSFGF